MNAQEEGNQIQSLATHRSQQSKQLGIPSSQEKGNPVIYGRNR